MIQCCCLRCGMLASKQGKTAEAMLSLDALLQVEEKARSGAVGSAQRAGTAEPVTPQAALADDTPEDEATKLARKEKIMSRVMEH